MVIYTCILDGVIYECIDDGFMRILNGPNGEFRYDFESIIPYILPTNSEEKYDHEKEGSIIKKSNWKSKI